MDGGMGLARRTGRNALVNGVTQVLGKALTLVWTLVAARRLSPADFGLFFYALAVAQLLTGLAEWGFDTRMVQLASRSPERAGRLARAALVLEAALALPLLVAGALVLAVHHRPGGEVVVLVVFLAVELDVLSDTCRAIGQAAQQQAGVSSALVVQRLVTAAAAVVAVALSHDVRALAVAFAAGSAVGLGAHLTAVRWLRLPPARGWSRDVPLLVRGSSVLGLSAMALIGLAKVDTLVLGLIRGEVAVGGYVAAYRMLETVLFVSFALGSALLPVMARGGSGAVAGPMRVAGAALAAAYLPFAVLCLLEAGPMLRLLYGAPFAGGAAQLRWLGLAALPYGLAYVGEGALVASGRSRSMLAVAVGALGVNVGLNLVLVPLAGGTGAAAATAVSYGFEAAAILALLRDLLPWASLARGLVPPLGAAGGAALALLVAPGPLGVRLGVALAVDLALLVALQRWVMPTDLRAAMALLGRPAGRRTASWPPGGR